MKNIEYQTSQVQPMHKPMELAKQLNVSRATMYRWLQSGRLHSLKIGGIRLVPESAVRDLLEAS